MLNTFVEKAGDTVYVVLSGRMDGGASCDWLRSSVKSLVASGERRFVFDVSDVVSMSSRGIGCLVASYASIHANGGSMVLHDPNPRVLHVLEVTRLVPGVFRIADASGKPRRSHVELAAVAGVSHAPPPPRSL